jgi:cyanophycinase
MYVMRRRFALPLLCGAALPLAAQRAAGPANTAAPVGARVGPDRGTVIVVGGGAIGPEIYSAFINAAGGPNALIVDVPTAGGDSVYGQNAPGVRAWKKAGARNVVVLHTIDRKLADSDSFTAVLRRAGGVWFEGGRQYHLVDSYAGTKTERAFRDVLARGGVIGGSSAGASILGDFLVRGAPSNDNFIMDYPGYEKGFGYLRNVGIDQHVVARERLADLADSIVPKYPHLLAISEDEGTAWVVRGDTATIIGRDKAFVYNGNDATDPGKPFLTLHPGDRYNLATRHVTHRVADTSPVSRALVDSLFAKYTDPARGGATVLVARGGRVFVDRAYGIGPQAKYMPATTVPQFALGDIKSVFTAMCDQLAIPPARGRGGNATPLQQCVSRAIATPVGLHKTNATADGQIFSDVDELYRLALGLDAAGTYTPDTTKTASRRFNAVRGWTIDSFHGTPRLTAYGAAGGKRSAFVRIPDHDATIIILTNDDAADAKAIADRISVRLMAPPKR